MSTLRRTAAIAAAATAMAACTAGEPVTPDASEAADESPDGDPTVEEADEPEVDNSTLVVAISQDPGNFNPAITTSGGTHTASELLYNGLVRVTADLEIEGDLAESWEILEDGAQYVFTLRDDVVWHDGEPFTSEDVKFSFEEVLLQFHSRTSASLGGALESIETPDELTVVFNFSFPYAPLLQQLDVTEAPIVAEHVYAGTDPQTAEANLAPIGTGPFRFVSYQPDTEIRFARNEDYFREGLPIFEEVVQRIIPEDTNAVLAFEQGEVDWLWGVPGPDLERLAADPEVSLLPTTKNPGGGNCIMTLSFNLEQPMFADVDVRRAIALAIDQQPYLDNILFGAGAVASAPISSGIPFAHHPDVAMPGFDPDEAATLLDDAGWTLPDGADVRVADGVPGVDDGTELQIRWHAFPGFSRYGELMREQLSGVGIDLVVEPLERGAFIETVFAEPGERDWDTNVISYCNQSDPEIGVRRMYISSNIKAIPFSNASSYVNADVDALFDAAREEVDTDARSELYRQISEILVTELPYYWLVETRSTRVHRANCTGFLPFGHFAEAASCS